MTDSRLAEIAARAATRYTPAYTTPGTSILAIKCEQAENDRDYLLTEVARLTAENEALMLIANETDRVLREVMPILTQYKDDRTDLATARNMLLYRLQQRNRHDKASDE